MKWGNKKVEDGAAGQLRFDGSVNSQPSTEYIPSDQSKNNKQKNKMGQMSPMGAAGQMGQANQMNQGVAKAPKRKMEKRQLIIIIVAVVLGLIIIAGLIWFLIVNLNQPDPNDPTDMSASTEAIRNEENRVVYETVLDEATSQEDPEKAEEVFQEAIQAAGNNSGTVSAIQVSQLQYWLEQGDYNKLIDEGKLPDGTENVDSDGYALCENPTLGLDLRIWCHNMLATSYKYMDELELYQYHSARWAQLVNEKAATVHPTE